MSYRDPYDDGLAAITTSWWRWPVSLTGMGVVATLCYTLATCSKACADYVRDPSPCTDSTVIVKSSDSRQECVGGARSIVIVHGENAVLHCVCSRDVDGGAP